MIGGKVPKNIERVKFMLVTSAKVLVTSLKDERQKKSWHKVNLAKVLMAMGL